MKSLDLGNPGFRSFKKLNNVNDDAATILATCVHNLQELILDNNFIKKQGVDALSSAIRKLDTPVITIFYNPTVF